MRAAQEHGDRTLNESFSFGTLPETRDRSKMRDEEPNIVISGLSGALTRDGVTVDFQIYRLEREPHEWSLEVINDKRTSIVWDDTFPSDKMAYEELLRTVSEEGMSCFLDSAKIVPFRR